MWPSFLVREETESNSSCFEEACEEEACFYYCNVQVTAEQYHVISEDVVQLQTEFQYIPGDQVC